jgi:aspartate/methionine/tyrosine aminotransferase
MTATSPTRQPTTNRWASRRVSAMPKSVFAAMDNAKTAARDKGLDVIDLSIGSSDMPPPAVAIDALRDATHDMASYGYCLASRTKPLRDTVADWYNRRFDPPTQVDADANVLPVIGAQEGLANLLFAVTDPGDVILAPNPAYPSYFGAIALAGLERFDTPLLVENDFLPELDKIPAEVVARAKILLISYPNNPTTATAPREFFQAAIHFCQKHDILLVHDFPYVDMTFGDYRAPSLFEFEGGLDVGIEIYSCSKSFHMSGLRIGWVVGSEDAVTALAQAKSAIDFNQYLGIQQAAIAAIRAGENDPKMLQETANRFERRRDALVAALADIGWDVPLPVASMYIWGKLPAGHDDAFTFATRLAAEVGVCVSPGDAFGSCGEGYVRFALVRDEDVLRKVARRIGTFLQG